MAKTIYSAVVNGVEITRETARTYTHAVVWVADNGKQVKSLSFSGSLRLAQKQVSQYAANHFNHKDELIAAGLNPDDFETLEDRNQNYRLVPGKVIVVEVSPKQK